MKIQTLLQSIAIKFLPNRFAKALKKLYYPWLLRSNHVNNKELDFRVIQYLVDRGDYVIDVGANIGLYTKYLSELVGEKGHVCAIKQISLTFDILVFIVRKLRLSNVETLKCAISDEDAAVQMVVPIRPNGRENFYRAKEFVL